MAYTVLGDTDIIPGLASQSATWNSLNGNGDELYAEIAPVIAAASVDVQVTSVTPVVVHRFKVPANYDEHNIQCIVRWKNSSGTATVTFTLDDGVNPVDTATGTTVSAAFVNTTVTLTIVNSVASSTPRELKVELESTTGTVIMESIHISLAPAAPTAAPLTSGYRRSDPGWETANEPVPRELAGRLVEQPRDIATDRPACLCTIADDISAVNSRAWYTTNAAAPTAVASFSAPNDPGSRDFTLHVYVDRDGTAVPDVTVYIGAYVFNTTSTGWTSWTQKMDGLALVDLNFVTAFDSAAGGYVFLRTLQLFREPTT